MLFREIEIVALYSLSIIYFANYIDNPYIVPLTLCAIPISITLYIDKHTKAVPQIFRSASVFLMYLAYVKIVFDTVGYSVDRLALICSYLLLTDIVSYVFHSIDGLVLTYIVMLLIYHVSVGSMQIYMEILLPIVVLATLVINIVKEFLKPWHAVILTAILNTIQFLVDKISILLWSLILIPQLMQFNSIEPKVVDKSLIYISTAIILSILLSKISTPIYIAYANIISIYCLYTMNSIFSTLKYSKESIPNNNPDSAYLET